MGKGKNSLTVFDFSKAFDAQRLLVLRHFMEEKGQSLEGLLLEYLTSLYKRYVPPKSQETLDIVCAPLPGREKPAQDHHFSEGETEK